ncbi:MAG: mechanosensitive ion channel [Lachnospiraceae bacterium]|jgi:hypothetical protein|nr:mechanosensitive ion channel [Lachnospiraceae bacterium]
MFQDALNRIVGALPTVLQSILLIVLGIILAIIVRNVVVKLGTKLKLDEKLAKVGLGELSKNFVKLLANVLALIVFILFLPGILGKLGLDSITTPINEMMTKFLAFIPQLLGAAVIFALGYLIAKIVKQLLIVLLQKTKIDSLQEKIGIGEQTEATKFSTLIGNLVFVIIIIPVAIAALHVLQLHSISDPAVSMLSSIFNMLPLIFVAILLLAVGILIAKLICSILSGILTGVGVDNVLKKFIKEENASKFSLVKVIVEITRFVIIILFAVQALNVLKLEFMTKVGTVIVSYLPSLLFAIVIIIAGYLFGSWLSSIIEKSTNSKVGGTLAKSAILVLVGFIVLNQLGFAMEIVNTVFIIVFVALAVAFAIAFGIGGKDTAKKLLEKLEKKLDSK